MVTKALLVRLEAKPGREGDVESFLRGGLPIVEQEPATTAWFAFRIGASTFGTFDVFPDEAGRQAHLSGGVAQALKEKSSDLFSTPPVIEDGAGCVCPRCWTIIPATSSPGNSARPCGPRTSPIHWTLHWPSQSVIRPMCSIGRACSVTMDPVISPRILPITSAPMAWIMFAVLRSIPRHRERSNAGIVQNAIEALGYRINPLGAELRRGQRNLVGAIVADFQNAKSAQLLSELEKQVESRGYTLMVASSRGSHDREADLVGRMQDWRVAGVVVESVSGRQKASMLLEEGPPALFLGSHWTKGVHDLVVDDVPTAIKDALKLSRRRPKSVFLAEGFREEYLKDEIELAGDCLVRKVSDLDMSGPVFLIDEADQTVQHSNRPDEGRTPKVTHLYSDVLNTSVAAVTLLSERLENPETPKAVQKVAMKVSSSP